MATQPGGAVGKSVRRREDVPLLVGAAAFLDDIAVDGVREVAFLRSPVAHARLASTDIAQAAGLPGIDAILLARDLDLPPLVSACEFPNAYCPPRPLLATDLVRYVGEPIAVVVAESRYAAEDALEAIEVEFTERSPIGDAEQALAEGTAPLHEGRPNAYFDSTVEVGDVESAFAEAAAVVEREFRHARVNPAPIEGRGVLVLPTETGVRMWSSTQVPHKLGLAVAEILGLEPEHVVVSCPSVGGGFGLKAHVHPEEIVVAAAARRLERALKWTEDRVENLTGAGHAREQRLRVRAAADADGHLTALDVDQLVDQGAYGSYPHGTTLEAHTTSGLLPGPYRLGSYRVRSRAAATTKCPQGAYRGVGFVVAAWVHERIMDVLAAELGTDRAKIRMRNLIDRDEFPYETLTRQRYDSGDYRRALELALRRIGYDAFADEQRRAREQGRLLGLGLSCYVEPTGMNSAVFRARGMVGVEGYDAAHVAVDAGGTATVWTTTPSIGQGADTTFAQIVADALGFELERIRVAAADTSVGGLSGTGTFASRSAVSGGGAVVAAAAEVRSRLLADASERLEASVEDLEIVDGGIRVVGSPEASIPVRDLVAAHGPDRYRFSAQWDPPAVAYPYATHACVVEVDPDSGAVSILRYVVVEDCGRMVNPVIVEGQIQGAVAQGIAEALYEQVEFDTESQNRSSSFVDYLLPTAREVPALSIEHLETPSPISVRGFKGVGEGGTVGAPAAVASAVCDAVGAQLDELPLKPEIVRAAARRFRSSAATKAVRE